MKTQTSLNTSDIVTADQLEPKASKIFRQTFTALILTVALIGNMVVLRTVLKMRGRKRFIYILVGNLAAGELGQIILMPFLLYYEDTWQRGWHFGGFLCAVINPVHNVFLTNVTVTLAAIAIYRCVIIYSPILQNVSRHKTKLLIASFWCLGVAIAIPQLVKRRLMPCYALDNVTIIEKCCRLSWDSEIYNIYNLTWLIVVGFIPLVLMVAAYVLVAVKINQHLFIIQKEYPREDQSLATCCPECENKPEASLPMNQVTEDNAAEEDQDAKNETVEMENNLLKMMYLVVGSFVIFYYPYPILLVLYHYKILEGWTNSYTFGLYSSFVLSNIPSALHPFFYGTRSKFFGKAFWRLLTCKL